MLTAPERAATVDSIAAVQVAGGMIPWFPDGHADPWNHVEAAMALSVGGRRAEAEGAYQWLVDTQRQDGAWHQYYRASGLGQPPVVEVALLDTNVSAYVATGAWHHYLATGDAGFLETMWPVVERAMGFVLDLQTPGGEVIWARHPDGTAWSFALLTASSSTCFSLRCAIAAARRLGRHRPHWETAAARLARAIVRRPQAFMPKDRWAMDWYYPVLTGVVGGESAARRLDEGRNRFVLEGLGVRCVSDRPWVTAAETSEAALAYAVAGRVEDAARLLGWTDHLRADDGSYFTGMVHPQRDLFPARERSTYSAAAVVLADDALAATGPASGLFVGHRLPALPAVGAAASDAASDADLRRAPANMGE
ncbi:MAG: prenyltransferase [Actinobacteria bacterium]|nr:prenyltransferase [Actinomycetota bacterium]